MSTNIKCWNCDTAYDSNKHKDCPVCDRNWTDSPVYSNDYDPGTRLSVKIDYDKQKMKPILVVYMILFVIVLTSCGITKHVVPETGSFFVTRNDTCTRETVFIQYKQDVFGSKISLKFTSKRDTLDYSKLFRRYDANTYSNLDATVRLYAGEMLRIENIKDTIVVDYICH